MRQFGVAYPFSERADDAFSVIAEYHYGPILDPIRSLVLFGKGQDVDTVFVDGQMIVKGGHVLNADEDALRAAAPDIKRRLAQAAAERDPMGRTLQSITTLL